MKHFLRILWLLIFAGGIMLGRWYAYGPWWPVASNDWVRFGPAPVFFTSAWVELVLIAAIASYRSKSVERRRGRFQFGLATMLLIVTAAAVTLGLFKWFHGTTPVPTFQSLEEILTPYDNFDVIQKPDRPGPYAWLGEVAVGRGGTLAGSFYADGKTCSFRIPGVPGEEFRAVGLATKDGGDMTYVVLKLRHAGTTQPDKATRSTGEQSQRQH